MSDTTSLTVLKLLGKGRGLTFVAQALKLEPKDVLAVAREHGVVRKTGEMDAAAAAYAATKLQQQATAPRLPERTAPQRPARETMPGHATAAVAPRRNLSPPAAPHPAVQTPHPVGPGGPRPLPGYVLIDVSRIVTDGRNVRRRLGDLDELAASIAQVGILQPITVTTQPDGRYRVDIGHRRFAAARRAGLSEVPCIVRAGRTDAASVRVARLIENLHRAQLEPLEEAEAFDALIEEGLTQAEVARRVGISPATVSTRLALLALPADAKQMLRDGHLPLTEAMKLGAQVRAKGAGRVHNKAPQQPDYWATHRLADEIRRACDHYGRRRYGRTGCGPCIEAAIRSDEGLRLLTNPTARKDRSA